VTGFRIRPAEEGDRQSLARLLAAVAEERDGIATEPPVDVERLAGRWQSLGVFPHNEAAIALYRKFGFVDEGRRSEHIRRTNGERWDLIEMGLLL
jgi:ribosomal protein S18 acetylase RimI-like enzyme